MKNYETISVVDNDTMLLDQHSFWNLDLIKQINLTNEIFIIPDSKVEFNKNWCRWQVLKDSVKVVSEKEFLNPSYPSVPLLFGSQFGLQSGGIKAKSDNKKIKVAVLGKSLLSGHISGLSFGYIDSKGNYSKI